MARYDKPVVQRTHRAFSIKDQTWSNLHQDVLELMFPARRTNRFDGGIKVDLFADIYDSTPQQAISSLANSLVSTLTPAWTSWGAFVPSQLMDEATRDALKDDLKPINDSLFQAIRRSNFIREIRPTFIDIIFGNGAILVEHDGRNGLCFRNIPIESFAFDTTYNGDPWYTYHKDEMRIDEMYEMYGKKTPELNRSEFQKLLKDDPSQRIPFVIAVEPMDARKPNTKFVETIFINKDNMEYIELSRKERNYNPYIVGRWELVPGTSWGIGPGIISYGDARYLNMIQEIGLKAGLLSVNPPHLSSDGEIINNKTVKFAPGTIIPVDSTEQGNQSLVPYNFVGDVRILDYEVNRRRDDLKKMFHADRFGPPTGTPMTAQEVIERTNLINQELGSTVGLLEMDLLHPIVVRSMYVLADHHRDPQMRKKFKAVLEDINDVDVLFLSELARARRAQNVGNIMELVTIAVELGQVDPNAGDVIDIEKAVRQIGSDLQVPDHIIRTKKEVQARQQQRNQQQANALQAASEAGLIGGDSGPVPDGAV
jgi:hypothetical protein